MSEVNRMCRKQLTNIPGTYLQLDLLTFCNTAIGWYHLTIFPDLISDASTALPKLLIRVQIKCNCPMLAEKIRGFKWLVADVQWLHVSRHAVHAAT